MDRGKALPVQILSPNSGAPFAMSKSGNTPAVVQVAGLGRGLGQAEAALLMFEPIMNAMGNIIGKMEQILGIGGGRREADEIVPVQNRIHHEVLAPIAEAVNSSHAQYLSQSQIQQLLDMLLDTEETWLNFLHNTEWSDGRAATQAENDLAFLFADQKRKLYALLQHAPIQTTVPIGGGITSTDSPRYTTGGMDILRSGFSFDTQSVLPWILAGAFIFMLPKIGRR